MTAGPYAEPNHQSFAVAGGDGTAVLLLHGFMGTPNELRPLAGALNEAGCAVHAPLLPGFGSELERLPRLPWRAWVDAATEAWRALRDTHARRILLGFSMGAAVAIHVAASDPPERLVLLAPFWKMADPRARLLPIARFAMREFRPFAEADFTNPELRHGLRQIDPALDLDDPATTARIRREWTIPTAALVQLQRLGRSAFATAPAVHGDTLVIQGLEDDTSLPPFTRDLVQRLGGEPRLLELPGGHQLVQPIGPSWDDVRDSVVAFATGREIG